MGDETVRAIKIESELEFEASPEAVFEAMTTRQADWYPYNYGGERLKRIVFETKVGGLCYEDWGDGAGTLYGVVAYYDYPKVVCLRGHLGGGVSLEQWFRVEAAGRGAILKHSMVAFGEISDDDEIGIRTHGDLKKFEKNLRDFLET